jgi:hypothetical protein
MNRTERHSELKPNSFRAALAKMTAAIVARQWIGNMLLFLLALAWLRIPDSHEWQFVCSMISSLLLVFAFLWLQVTTMMRLRPTSPNPRRSMQILFLVAFFALWMIVMRPISAVSDHAALYAGLINSQLSPHMRVLFTYDRIVQLQLCIYLLVKWVLAGILLPFAMEIVVSGVKAVSFRRASQVCLRWQYWLAVFALGIVGTEITQALVVWTPGKGLVGETASVVARLGVAYTLDILIWCFVLALVAIYLERARD